MIANVTDDINPGISFRGTYRYVGCRGEVCLDPSGCRRDEHWTRRRQVEKVSDRALSTRVGLTPSAEWQ